MVLGRKVGEDLRRHWRMWEVCLEDLVKGDMRVLIIARKERIGVNRAAMRIRKRFWRMCRCFGEDELRGIVGTDRCIRGAWDERHCFHMKTYYLRHPIRGVLRHAAFPRHQGA